MSTPADAIQSGLKYIRSQQLPNGGFASESSPALEPWNATFTYHTTFVPSLILASLSRIDTPAAMAIRKPLAQFLLHQKSEHWSFNYWAKEAPEHKRLPYPDDLDDTFCALAGLYLHDSALVSEAALANMVQLLVATESKVGGPYRTWLVTPDADKAWQDVDVAVNTNIAYMLSFVSEPLPNLQKFMEQAIMKKQYSSPYYPSSVPVWYYLARSCRGSALTTLTKHIEAHCAHTKNLPALDAALLLSSLTHLKLDSPHIRRLRKQLFASQRADGSWPSAAFCMDPAHEGHKYYHGSPALTTAFVLEALTRSTPITTASQPRKTTPPQAMKIQQQITEHAQQHLQVLGTSVRQPVDKMLSRIIAADPQHEITLLPYLFAQSAQLYISNKQREQTFTHLGLANLYGWMAYTIYDDFLDDEGQPLQLSAANVALRSSVLHFQRALPRETNFQAYVAQVFNTIDNANTWEIMHCRFSVTNKYIEVGQLPRFGQRQKLAERSLGHGLGPLATMVASGYTLDSPHTTALDQAFRHYLIARQLNDDAHDWKQDVQRGHITYVVAMILEQLGLTGRQDFTSLLPAMEKQFWNHTLIDVCKIMRRHCQRGRQLLAKSTDLPANNLVVKLLQKTELSCNETLATQKQATSFLQNYRLETHKS